MSISWEAAVAAHRAGDIETAERGYQALYVSNYWAKHNLGALYADAGRLEDAERVLRDALAERPHSSPSLHTLGTVLLAQGRYAEGWPLWEHRRWAPETTTIDPVQTWPDIAPEWRGQPLSGPLLVIGEQGFGDQIMFARFVPLLAARGIEVIGLADRELVPLFPWATVARRQLPPGVAAWALIGSLPLHLGITLENLPAPPPPDVPLRSRGGIGVVSRGRSSHVHDRSRSLSDADAASLLTLGRDLSPEATGAHDFKETAEIVADLDLVISVDTAIAHLAATMGKPTWILLGEHGVDWRWMADRTDSPWYPSIRLFRRRRGEPWAAVLSQVVAALAAHANLGDDHQAVAARL